MKKKTNYQERVSKLIWVGNLYMIIGFFTLYSKDAPIIAWVVFLSTLVIIYCMAVLSDAIFDSLSERINIQSTWLDKRLESIELSVGSTKGQEKWNAEAIPTNDKEHYFYNYPEKLED